MEFQGMSVIINDAMSWFIISFTVLTTLTRYERYFSHDSMMSKIKSLENCDLQRVIWVGHFFHWSWRSLLIRDLNWNCNLNSLLLSGFCKTGNSVNRNSNGQDLTWCGSCSPLPLAKWDVWCHPRFRIHCPSYTANTTHCCSLLLKDRILRGLVIYHISHTKGNIMDPEGDTLHKMCRQTDNTHSYVRWNKDSS